MAHRPRTIDQIENLVVNIITIGENICETYMAQNLDAKAAWKIMSRETQANIWQHRLAWNPKKMTSGV